MPCNASQSETAKNWRRGVDQGRVVRFRNAARESGVRQAQVSTAQSTINASTTVPTSAGNRPAQSSAGLDGHPLNPTTNVVNDSRAAGPPRAAPIIDQNASARTLRWRESSRKIAERMMKQRIAVNENVSKSAPSAQSLDGRLPTIPSVAGQTASTRRISSSTTTGVPSTNEPTTRPTKIYRPPTAPTRATPISSGVQKKPATPTTITSEIPPAISTQVNQLASTPPNAVPTLDQTTAARNSSRRETCLRDASKAVESATGVQSTAVRKASSESLPTAPTRCVPPSTTAAKEAISASAPATSNRPIPNRPIPNRPIHTPTPCELSRPTPTPTSSNKATPASSSNKSPTINATKAASPSTQSPSSPSSISTTTPSTSSTTSSSATPHAIPPTHHPSPTTQPRTDRAICPNLAALTFGEASPEDTFVYDPAIGGLVHNRLRRCLGCAQHEVHARLYQFADEQFAGMGATLDMLKGAWRPSVFGFGGEVEREFVAKVLEVESAVEELKGWMTQPERREKWSEDSKRQLREIEVKNEASGFVDRRADFKQKVKWEEYLRERKRLSQDIASELAVMEYVLKEREDLLKNLAAEHAGHARSPQSAAAAASSSKKACVGAATAQAQA